MTRSSSLIAAALFLSLGVLNGKGATPGPNTFFGLTNLWTVHLTFERAQWTAMNAGGQDRGGLLRRLGVPNFRPAAPQANRPGPPKGPGPGGHDFPWATCTFACGDAVLTNVAVRFKGNSSFNMSRETFKRPFKLDFNRGHKARRFAGLKELSLNNNFNDSTQFREALGYEVCREAGLPAPRTAFARVTLTVDGQRTNEFLGLYTLAEPIEGDFLKSHFGTKRGLLVKPERLPTLEYLGEDWSAYTNRYNPKTETKPAEAERFIALTRLVARAEEATFRRELPAQVDLSNFLLYLAVNALMANYDSFIGNGHNYYFFQPSDGGKAVFIPWDLNEAFGGHPPLGPRLRQAELSVLRPQAEQNRFIERVLATPEWMAEYRRQLGKLLTNACSPAHLQAEASQLAALTRETVFAESTVAKAAFQRAALGQTNIVIPTGNLGRPGPGPRIDPQEAPFAEWVSVRMRNAAEELAGQRAGVRPEMRGFGPPPGLRPR